MDTRVTAGQKRQKQSWPVRAYVPHQRRCWWWVLVCIVVCGCNLLKPAANRQTAAPPTVTIVAPSSSQVAAPPPPPLATTDTTATSPGTPPQPLPVRTAIADPLPAPALNPAPKTRPAKSNQNLRVTTAPAKVQSSHRVTNSVANTPTQQTTVTYIPREAAAAMVIKGPPRPPQPRSSRIAVPLCLGIAVGAGAVALFFIAKRRSRLSIRKGRKDELSLPSEFKLRESAIQPEAPFGMLAPEKPQRRSIRELLVPLLASMTPAIRFLVSKVPVDGIVMACRAVWQRISVPAPAIADKCSSTPQSSASADSKFGEVPATVPSPELGVRGKPAESASSTTSAKSVVPASPPVAAPSLDKPLTVSEVTGEAMRPPRQPSKEAPIPVS